MVEMSEDTMQVLSVPCPHCRDAKDDAFEVMARNAIDWTKCDACSRPYQYVIAECDRCDAETVFSWRERPQASEVARLNCHACGAGLGATIDAQLSSPIGLG